MSDVPIKSLHLKRIKIRNNRTKALLVFIISLAFLLLVIVENIILPEENLLSNLQLINQPPSWKHPFGTDWLGRDMLTRTVYGLRISLIVGAIASFLTLFIGISLGLISSINKSIDAFVFWLINLFLSLPATIFAILISVVFGRGLRGVIIAISLTHWAHFARLVRASVQEIQNADYIQVSKKFGKTPFWIAIHHILPHLVPLSLVGLTLTFPQAILHEATLTLLGFGLSPHQPAIGIILSESIKYLSSGKWWLMVFPGLSLLIFVLSIQQLGESTKSLIDPITLRE